MNTESCEIRFCTPSKASSISLSVDGCCCRACGHCQILVSVGLRYVKLALIFLWRQYSQAPTLRTAATSDLLCGSNGRRRRFGTGVPLLTPKPGSEEAGRGGDCTCAAVPRVPFCTCGLSACSFLSSDGVESGDVSGDNIITGMLGRYTELIC
jgi:hypothetical protein